MRTGLVLPCAWCSTSTATRRRHEFLRGIMRSAASLTYAQAQRAFDGKPDDAHRDDGARRAGAVVGLPIRRWRKARDARDPLDLDLPERRIVIGADGKVEIHRLSRAAGIHAADRGIHDPGQCRGGRKRWRSARMPLIYRIHEAPSKEKLFAFSDYLRTIGIAFAKGQVDQARRVQPHPGECQRTARMPR